MPTPGLDHIGVCVVFFCHDGKGNFVMMKRSENTRDEQGRWDTGGGAIEMHENIEDKLKKEIKEEYCTEVLEYEFLGYRDVHRELNGKRTHWIALDFKVLVDASEVKIGEAHKFDDIGWFRLDHLPENIHSQLPLFFRKYHQELEKNSNNNQ